MIEFRPLRGALACVGVVVIAGCAGTTKTEMATEDPMEIRRISENQCGDWDWRGQGEEDAKQGIPAEKALASYNEDCPENPPVRADYMEGYSEAAG